jgi:hypothetical protein
MGCWREPEPARADGCDADCRAGERERGDVPEPALALVAELPVQLDDQSVSAVLHVSLVGQIRARVLSLTTWQTVRPLDGTQIQQLQVRLHSGLDLGEHPEDQRAVVLPRPAVEKAP